MAPVSPAHELSTHRLHRLLRDFVLDLTADGKQISEQQYMENALAEVHQKPSGNYTLTAHANHALIPCG